MFAQRGLRGALFFSILLGLLGCATLRAGVDYNQALREFKNNHYEIAERYLRSALEKNPGDERATSLLGWVRFKQGVTEEAGRLFTEAYQRNPENLATIEGLGWVQYLDGQDELAEKKFKKLVQYTESHLRHLHWIYYSVNDQKFIESIYSEANYVLGLIAKRRGRWGGARAYFEEALSQRSEFIDHGIIAEELADTLFQLGEYKAAATFYREFLSKNPKDLFLLNRNAWCLYQTGNIEEAKKLYLKSKEFSLTAAEFYQKSFGSQSVTQRICAKRMAEPYYGLALIYMKEGRPEVALEEISSAIKISPFFHHPEEIALLLDQHPEWREAFLLRSLGRPLP